MSTLAIPSVPSGSIIAVIIILSAVSISPENIGIIISLEWITYVYLLYVFCSGCYVNTKRPFLSENPTSVLMYH